MTNPYAEIPIAAPVGDEPILVEINARMVPLILRAIDRYRYRKSWLTDADYERGLHQINTLEVALLTGTQTIIDAIDRLYRLVDSIYNGTAYTTAPNPTDPARPLVSPAIPAAPANAVGIAPGLRRQLLDMQGIINPGWFGIGGQPARLSDIVNALRVGGVQDAERIDTALEALTAASSTANVFGVVRGLLTDVVDTGLEGGVLAVLIASSIANAATQGVLSGQLDRLIQSLDGGGPVGPGDNVLLAMRGIVEAGPARNVATLLDELRLAVEADPNNADLAAKLDEIIALVS